MATERIQLFDQAEITRRAISLASLNEPPRSLPLLVALAGTPGIPELVCREDVMLAALGAIVGVQLPKDGMAMSMAFLWAQSKTHTMAFCIEPHTVELSKPKRPQVWRREIAKYLIENATPDLLWEDAMGGMAATITYITKREREESIRLSSDDIRDQYCKSLKFNLQRKMSAIAKVTRRGMGNRLIGSRSAVEDLLKYIPEQQQSRLKIIIYEDGEIQKDPWLLVGYNGSNPYDTGLAFVYSKGRGALVDNNTKAYWRRLI